MIHVALELTEEQFLLLRGLAARATTEEEMRRDRMHARPRGAHTPARLAEVAQNASDFAEIERQMEAQS